MPLAEDPPATSAGERLGATHTGPFEQSLFATPPMTQPPAHRGPGGHHLPDLIAALLEGRESAAEALYHELTGPVRDSAARFFVPDSADIDDVVQETILATFDYLKRKGGFQGDLIAFAVTVARNRCRNIVNQRARRPHVPLEPLSEWIANPQRSPLDLLTEREAMTALQAGLNALGRVCRLVLRAFYIEGRPMEEIRRELGLKTVQGVYYRRAVCLERLARLVAPRLGGP